MHSCQFLNLIYVWVISGLILYTAAPEIVGQLKECVSKSFILHILHMLSSHQHFTFSFAYYILKIHIHQESYKCISIRI